MRIFDRAGRFWGSYLAGLLFIPVLISPAVLLGPWAGGAILFLAGCFAGKERAGFLAEYLARTERAVFLTGEIRVRMPIIPLALLLCNAILLWCALPGLLPRTGVFENVLWSELILGIEILPFGVIPWLLRTALSLRPLEFFTWACPFLYLAGYCVTLFWLLPGPHKAVYRAVALLPLFLGGAIAIEGRDFHDRRIAELERRAAVQAEIDARPAPFDLKLHKNVYSEPERLQSTPSFVVSAPPAPVLGFAAPLRRLAMSFAVTCITVPDDGNKNIFAVPGSGSDSPIYLLWGTTDNHADIVLVTGEDTGDLHRASKNSQDMVSTPIGRDALVFFTHADNPVDSITAEQARAVYSGAIANWTKLGGNAAPIKAFQQVQSHYAQNRALRVFMGEVPVRKPEQHVYVKIDSASFRNEWIDAAEYDNTPGALGYALRGSLMHPEAEPGIKVLSLNGVAPTPENIRNGTYPGILPVYAITLRENAERPEVKGYIQWMQGPQGQELLEKCGLVGISPNTRK